MSRQKRTLKIVLLICVTVLSMLLTSCSKVPEIKDFNSLPRGAQKILNLYYYSGDIQTKSEYIATLNDKYAKTSIILPTFCEDTGSTDIVIEDVCLDKVDTTKAVISTTYNLSNGNSFEVLDLWDISGSKVTGYQTLRCEQCN